MWEKSTGEFVRYEKKLKEKLFNVVRVSSDDQEYTFVENEESKPMEVEVLKPQSKVGKKKKEVKSKKSKPEIIKQDENELPESEETKPQKNKYKRALRSRKNKNKE